MIVLSDEFFQEISAHPIPTDLDAVRVLAPSPVVLDLFMWLSYRCFASKGEEQIPIFGDFGLAAQLGNVEYARPRRFREKLEQWLKTIRTMWPECPARLNNAGTHLLSAPQSRFTVGRAQMFAPKPQQFQLSPRVPLTTIDETVSACLGTTRVSGNAQPAAFNRQVAMYLAKHAGGWSTTRIGKFYNGRHHSTVCYALKRIEALRDAHPDIDSLLTNLADEIRSTPIRP